MKRNSSRFMEDSDGNSTWKASQPEQLTSCSLKFCIKRTRIYEKQTMAHDNQTAFQLQLIFGKTRPSKFGMARQPQHHRVVLHIKKQLQDGQITRQTNHQSHQPLNIIYLFIQSQFVQTCSFALASHHNTSHGLSKSLLNGSNKVGIGVLQIKRTTSLLLRMQCSVLGSSSSNQLLVMSVFCGSMSSFGCSSQRSVVQESIGDTASKGRPSEGLQG